jgi:hypothetical protein
VLVDLPTELLDSVLGLLSRKDLLQACYVSKFVKSRAEYYLYRSFSFEDEVPNELHELRNIGPIKKDDLALFIRSLIRRRELAGFVKSVTHLGWKDVRCWTERAEQTDTAHEGSSEGSTVLTDAIAEEAVVEHYEDSESDESAWESDVDDEEDDNGDMKRENPFSSIEQQLLTEVALQPQFIARAKPQDEDRHLHLWDPRMVASLRREHTSFLLAILLLLASNLESVTLDMIRRDTGPDNQHRFLDIVLKYRLYLNLCDSQSLSGLSRLKRVALSLDRFDTLRCRYYQSLFRFPCVNHLTLTRIDREPFKWRIDDDDWPDTAIPLTITNGPLESFTAIHSPLNTQNLSLILQNTPNLRKISYDIRLSHRHKISSRVECDKLKDALMQVRNSLEELHLYITVDGGRGGTIHNLGSLAEFHNLSILRLPFTFLCGPKYKDAPAPTSKHGFKPSSAIGSLLPQGLRFLRLEDDMYDVPTYFEWTARERNKILCPYLIEYSIYTPLLKRFEFCIDELEKNTLFNRAKPDWESLRSHIRGCCEKAGLEYALVHTDEEDEEAVI